jgi:hypothetical protein
MTVAYPLEHHILERDKRFDGRVGAKEEGKTIFICRSEEGLKECKANIG